MSGLIWIVVAGIAAVALAGGGGGGAQGGANFGPPVGPSEHVKPGQGSPMESLLEGKAGPAVDQLHAELDDYLRRAGIDTGQVSAVDLTWLPASMKYAIPPRELWPNIVPTARIVQELNRRMGYNLAIRGYRPPWYNTQQKGSKNSTHQWFSAVDLRVPPEVEENRAAERRRLAEETVRVFVELGDEYQIGMGVYGSTTPSNVHIDTMKNRRTWEEAQDWIDKAA